MTNLHVIRPTQLRYPQSIPPYSSGSYKRDAIFIQKRFYCPLIRLEEKKFIMSVQAYYELYRGSRYRLIGWAFERTVTLFIIYANTSIVFPRTSLGLSLTDTLDDLINEGRIEPQLAMKILSTFDRAITEVLANKVRARINFKVPLAFCIFFPVLRWSCFWGLGLVGSLLLYLSLFFFFFFFFVFVCLFWGGNTIALTMLEFLSSTGSSGHIPVPWWSLDFSDKGCELQVGGPRDRHGG